MHIMVYFIAYYGSSKFHFKLNMIIIQLEHVVDRVMVPPDRASQCNHFCLYGKALILSTVMPLAGASNEGRLCACATLARQAGIALCAHSCFGTIVPVWDHLFCHNTGRQVSRGDIGPPRTQPEGELVGVVGRVSWQQIGSIGTSLVHPNGISRPCVLWCG